MTGTERRAGGKGRQTGSRSADRPAGGLPLRPLRDAAESGIRLPPAAGFRPAPAPGPGDTPPGRIPRRAIERGGLAPLARLLLRYPGLATALALPPLALSIPSVLAGDAVAALLGVFGLLAGLVFAASAAREMARDGIAPFPTPNSEDTP